MTTIHIINGDEHIYNLFFRVRPRKFHGCRTDNNIFFFNPSFSFGKKRETIEIKYTSLLRYFWFNDKSSRKFRREKKKKKNSDRCPSTIYFLEIHFCFGDHPRGKKMQRRPSLTDALGWHRENLTVLILVQITLVALQPRSARTSLRLALSLELFYNFKFFILEKYI